MSLGYSMSVYVYGSMCLVRVSYAKLKIEKPMISTMYLSVSRHFPLHLTLVAHIGIKGRVSV